MHLAPGRFETISRENRTPDRSADVSRLKDSCDLNTVKESAQMNFSKPATTLLAIVLTTAACASAQSDDRTAVANEVRPSQTMEFQKLNPAIAMAHAYGDRANGPHGSFGTFPADFITPFHVHSGSYRAVVIEGTMTNPFQGETAPPKMGPGSYWSVAAGAEHATACVSNTSCKFFFWADGPFDFTPVE